MGKNEKWQLVPFSNNPETKRKRKPKSCPRTEWSWLCLRLTSPTLNLEMSQSQWGVKNLDLGIFKSFFFCEMDAYQWVFWWSIWTSWSTLLDIQMSKPNTWIICQNYWKLFEGHLCNFICITTYRIRYMRLLHIFIEKGTLNMFPCIDYDIFVMFPDSFLLPKSTKKRRRVHPEVEAWWVVPRIRTCGHPWYLAGVL